MNEIKLIRSAIRGNKISLHTLLLLHRSQLYKIIHTYTNDEKIAIDTLCEATEDCIRTIHQLKREELFYTWMLRKHISRAVERYDYKRHLLSNLSTTYRTVAILLFGAQLQTNMVATILHTNQQAIIDMATQIDIDLQGKATIITEQFIRIPVPLQAIEYALQPPKTKRLFRSYLML
ncbi:hypothetical protein [Kurthia sibirica]|uniref:Uncharacterized protein n=1 Tax=Kurthia sibirica TaxID=202750 RepID=A0A2U3AN76_9BACL|nr:hypothetical protein [Kurthia sibirica]PWI25966.1 hypothetical protein DEX24_05390 [Kurthia sibirica]GEK35002.1 hypothetical protein KSI01_25350 [Kurthia sibirica]